jgi:hypothetical protein
MARFGEVSDAADKAPNSINNKKKYLTNYWCR